MSIYELAMQDREFRRLILIEFSFGEHQPQKIEKWLKKKYPYKVAEWRKVRINQKVVPMVAEGMTKEERTAILDKEEMYNKKI